MPGHKRPFSTLVLDLEKRRIALRLSALQRFYTSFFEARKSVKLKNRFLIEVARGTANPRKEMGSEIDFLVLRAIRSFNNHPQQCRLCREDVRDRLAEVDRRLLALEDHRPGRGRT